MAPWIIPALKAVLPHVGQIVNAAKPMFSEARQQASQNQHAQQAQHGHAETGDAIVNRQIAELQAVAAQNDAHIRELAAQLKSTVTALEQVAAQADAQARKQARLVWAACGLSVLATAIAIAALVTA